MRTRKKEITEKRYSYDEYRRTFYPKGNRKRSLVRGDSRAAGVRLAEEALEKILQEPINTQS